MTDSMQNLADEVAAWIGTGAAVISGPRAVPVTSVYSERPQVRQQSHAPFDSARLPRGALRKLLFFFYNLEDTGRS